MIVRHLRRIDHLDADAAEIVPRGTRRGRDARGAVAEDSRIGADRDDIDREKRSAKKRLVHRDRALGRIIRKCHGPLDQGRPPVVRTDRVVVLLPVRHVCVAPRMREPRLGAEPVGDSLDRLGCVSGAAVLQVELCDWLAVADGPRPLTVADHLRVKERRVGGPVDPVPLERINPGDGVRRILRNIVPRELDVVISHLGLHRGGRRGLGELIVGIVDRLHDRHHGTQLRQVRAVRESQAEPLMIAGLERERTRGKEERDIVVVHDGVVKTIDRGGIGELGIQPVGPVERVREEYDSVDRLIRVPFSRADPVHLEPGQPDLIGFVRIGLVEIRLARRRDPVPFAYVVGVGDAVGADIVIQGDPVHVLVAGPPYPGLERGTVLELAVVALKIDHVVARARIDVRGDRRLSDDLLPGAARAAFVHDAVQVVVNAVVGLPRSLEVRIPHIPGGRTQRPEPHAVPVDVPRIDEIQSRD